MNRRKFFKKLIIGTASITAIPTILESIPEKETLSKLRGYHGDILIVDDINSHEEDMEDLALSSLAWSDYKMTHPMRTWSCECGFIKSTG